MSKLQEKVLGVADLNIEKLRVEVDYLSENLSKEDSVMNLEELSAACKKIAKMEVCLQDEIPAYAKQDRTPVNAERVDELKEKLEEIASKLKGSTHEDVGMMIDEHASMARDFYFRPLDEEKVNELYKEALKNAPTRYVMAYYPEEDRLFVLKNKPLNIGFSAFEQFYKDNSPAIRAVVADLFIKQAKEKNYYKSEQFKLFKDEDVEKMFEAFGADPSNEVKQAFAIAIKENFNFSIPSQAIDDSRARFMCAVKNVLNDIAKNTNDQVRNVATQAIVSLSEKGYFEKAPTLKQERKMQNGLDI